MENLRFELAKKTTKFEKKLMCAANFKIRIFSRRDFNNY